MSLEFVYGRRRLSKPWPEKAQRYDRSATPKVTCTPRASRPHFHRILPIETTRGFDGLCHVPHGSISSVRGTGPESLKIKSLIERLHGHDVKEIIRHESDGGGRATAAYLSRLLKSSRSASRVASM